LIPTRSFILAVVPRVPGHKIQFFELEANPEILTCRYLEKAGVQADKMMNLRRGVDCTMFDPSKRSDSMRKKLAPNGEIILTCVSRLAPEKGFEFLSEAVKELDRQGFKFHLLVVGGNKNPQVVQDIKDMFGALNNEGKVTFTGMLRGEELARAYACGDIFLHCSITETFGLVVLESMASGVPVVARDEGGPSEIVADGKSGYLVAPSDLETFVSKVLKIGKDKELHKQMAEESRRMAEEATWEKINNRVAWKLAEALESGGESQQQNPGSQSFSIPIYSWLLLHAGLRDFLGRMFVDFRLMGGIGVIFGVWCGLVITWILVQMSLMVRTRAPWLREVVGGMVA
jgi:glycosyltransferase involved in cell wall biosynthesis